MKGVRDSVTWIIAANWFACGLMAFAIGGVAIDGGVVDGEFIVRFNPGDRGTSVPEALWLTSLVYTSLTIGLTPAALFVLFSFHRRREDRGVLDLVLGICAALWFLAFAIQAVVQLRESRVESAVVSGASDLHREAVATREVAFVRRPPPRASGSRLGEERLRDRAPATRADRKDERVT